MRSNRCAGNRCALRSLSSELAQHGAGEEVALDVVGVLDCGMSGEEPLSGSR